MEVRPVKSGEERDAAALVYEVTRGEPADSRRLAEFLHQAEMLGSDLSRQVVAVTSDGVVVGCAMYFPSTDDTAAATPPFCAVDHDSHGLRVSLLRALRGKARDDGIVMLQAFTAQDDAHAQTALSDAGFDELALMLFMQRLPRSDDRNICLDKQIRWIAYSEERRDEFECVVRKTYDGTLDCVGLGEARPTTLESYRRRGEIDPSLWFLAELDAQAVACLLLLSHPDEMSFEVGYLGVVPDHRGKGLSRKVMEKGLKELASRSPYAKLTLTVDEANVPALNVYDTLDFTETERKRVYFVLC